MACTLLATKLEEQPKTLHQIIEVYAKMYTERLLMVGITRSQRRRLEAIEKPYLGSFAATLSPRWSSYLSSIKRNHEIQHVPLNKTGPVYQEWHSTITKMENELLRQLGFTLYWIPDSHPHKFLLYFCQVLEWQQLQKQSSASKDSMVQCAWNYCNDACCYLDLECRYSAELIACAAILLTARQHNVTLPQHYWQVFLGNDDSIAQDLVDAANAMAGLVELARRSKAMNDDNDAGKTNVDDDDDDDDTQAVLDWLLATKGFVRSLVNRTPDQETSFNDPNSFLWEYQKEVLEKEFEKDYNNN
jgi:hypothetical protein